MNASGDPQLRPAAPKDADAVRALTRAAYADWAAMLGREPLPMGFDHGAMIRDHIVDGLWESDTLIAVIEMVARGDDLLIENIAVDPGTQGRGLGGRLLAHAEAAARKRGLDCVRLYTNSRFASNIAFYEARGYRREREEPIANGFVVHMRRDLPAPAMP